MNAREREMKMPEGWGLMLKILVAFGVVTFLTGLYFDSQRAWADWFLASYFLLQLSLAGIFFVALQYVTGAAWSVGIRRIPEAMALLLPVGALGLIATLTLHPAVYPWAATGASAGEGLEGFKRIWLSLPFFRARALFYLIVWFIFAVAIVRTSRRQDLDGDHAHTRRNIRLSAAFLVVLTLTLIPASFDWMMSLEPNWYSTVFAFYDFSGMFLGGLAALIVLAALVERLAPGEFSLTEEHRHDLGKLLFAFSTFWGYLWFCQYMLIWYANIPEETSYYVHRQHGAWGPLFLLNLLLSWALPFLILLQRRYKQSTQMLVTVAVIVLGGRCLDLYLMIFPAAVGPEPVVGLFEVGSWAGAAALYALLFFRVVRKAPLVPLKDPFLMESLNSSHGERSGRASGAPAALHS